MDGFRDLISRTGDILGIEGFEPDAEGVCILASEEAEILITHSSDILEMVLLTATLMPLPSPVPSAILASLRANMWFGQTHGATVSLNPETGNLELAMYMPLGALTPESLIESLEGFSAALLALRPFIADGGEGDIQPSADPECDTEEVAIDDVVVVLRHDDGDRSVVAAIDVGEIPEDDEAAQARELLEANHLFFGTAGASLALDAQSNHVFIQQRMWIRPGEEDAVPSHIAAFMETAQEWKSNIAARATADASAIPSPLNPMSGFIQV